MAYKEEKAAQDKGKLTNCNIRRVRAKRMSNLCSKKKKGGEALAEY